MYTYNKIRFSTEIVASGEILTYKEFYVFLVPKSDSSPLNAVFSGLLAGLRNEVQTFPLGAGFWNPVVVTRLDVTADHLSNYRIFVGTE